MIERIVEFGSMMKEHIQRAQTLEIHHIYLGPIIQNAMMQKLASEVSSAIITNLNYAKYFYVILDCTPNFILFVILLLILN